MEWIMEIVLIVFPLIIVSGIALFVVKSLTHKHEQGTLGKKKTKRAQNLLDSLIPFGMLLGCIIGIVSSSITSISLLSALSLGAGIGLLGGYFAYEIYSKNEEK